MSLIDNDPMALEADIFLLADAMSHRPYLSIEDRLRSGLELYRKPLQILNDKTYQAFAVSDQDHWLAVGDDNGTVLLFPAEARNFPWLSQQPFDKFHTSVITLLFNPGGKYPGRYLAYSSMKDPKKGDNYGHVTIIDTKTMKTVEGDVKHDHTPTMLVFSRNGEMLATLSDDPVIRVWEFSGSKPMIEIPKVEVPKAPDSKKVLDMRFSLDDKALITVTADGRMLTFLLADPLHPLVDNIGFPLLCAAFSPNNDWIAACGKDHSLTFVKTQRELAVPCPAQQKRSNPSQHPAHKKLSDSAPKKLPDEYEKCLPAWTYHDRYNLSVATFGRLNDWVAAGSIDGAFHLFRLGSKEEIVHVKDSGAITALAFSGDSRWVAVARQDGLRILEAATGVETARISQSAQVTAVGFNADSSLLMTLSDDGKLKIWQVIPASEKFRKSKSHINNVAMDVKGHVSLGAGQNFLIFDIREREGGEPLEITTEKPITNAIFSDSGEMFVATSGSDAKIYNTSRPASQHRLEWIKDLDRTSGGPQQDGNVSTMAISHDSTLVAVGDDKGTVRTYDSSKGKYSYKAIHREGSAVSSLAFSQDGKYLGVGTDDKKLYLYESKIAELEHSPKTWDEKNHPDLPCDEGISIQRFSPDSRFLVAACSNKVGIFNVGEAKVTVRFFKGAIAALDFSGDGHIFIGTDEGIIHILDTAFTETGRIRNPQKQIKQVLFDEKTNFVRCLSIGHSSDLIESFIAVDEFPATADGLVHQACSQICYPQTSECGKYNSEEDFHDFCAAAPGAQPKH